MKKFLIALLTALMLLACCATVSAESTAQLQLTADAYSGYGGDVVTLSLCLNADNLGGMQTTIQWNEGYLTYVEGSAAFADDFADSAALSLVNDSTAGSLRLVYGNTGGYTAEGEVVFTAQFLLTESVSGCTSFALTDTKLTDASAELAAMDCQTSGADVYTQIYDPGSAQIILSPGNRAPYIGDTVTLSMNVSSSGGTIGSLQGTIAYDVNMFEYVSGSAAFSDAAAEAAFTQIVNADTSGAVKFVYGALDGCPTGTLLTLQFKVLSDGYGYGLIHLNDVKATNAEADHLSLMTCDVVSAYLTIQKRPEVIYCTSRIDETGVRKGDTFTLRLSADGVTLGGLQATIGYNPDQLEYVSGSAAFTEAFADGASITMINDGTSGAIKLIYSNVNGYAPDGSDVFTAQFTVKTCDVNLDPIEVTSLKTTNASAESLSEITSQFLQGVSWSDVLTGHVEVVDAAVAATCTETGLTEGSHCSVCGTTLVEQTTVAALGHTEVIDAAVSATCTETGLTEGSHCSVCGTTLVAQTTVAALGHTEVIDSAVTPTCTETGLTEGSHCSACGTIFVAQTTVSALGHTEVIDPAVAPTCTETGLTEGSHCSVCGETLVVQTTVSALGHMEVIDSAVAPTCTETGLTEGSHCSVCGTIFIEQTTVPALGHTEVIDSAVSPTCTETGLTEGSHCSVCGTIFIEQTTVAALGHTEVIDAAVSATCTETGLTEGSHCSVCGTTLVAQNILPALGHTEVIDSAVIPTCTETGLTEGSHCSVCGETLVAQTTVSALGHTEVIDSAVIPTCTETGLTEGSHCSVCGETLVAQSIRPALGHAASMAQSVMETGVGDTITLWIDFGCDHADTAEIAWTASGTCDLELLSSSGGAATFAVRSAGVAAVTAEFADGATMPLECTVVARSGCRMYLPAALTRIDEEAFAGSGAQEFELPEGVTAIGSRAFADCAELVLVSLPGTLEEIAEDAFDGCDSLTLLCEENSVGHLYAQRLGIPCITR